MAIKWVTKLVANGRRRLVWFRADEVRRVRQMLCCMVASKRHDKEWGCMTLYARGGEEHEPERRSDNMEILRQWCCRIAGCWERPAWDWKISGLYGMLHLRPRRATLEEVKERCGLETRHMQILIALYDIGFLIDGAVCCESIIIVFTSACPV
jgi:hypothetical protein